MLTHILKDDSRSNSTPFEEIKSAASYALGNIVVGKIALIEPVKLIPALKVRTTSPSAFTRATVVIAVKYSIVERLEKINEIIYP
ncbi:Cullin-associated NEDD8-dissociated protein 1 [Glycine soja]|uniref:Cullin-associated NEDD8-dissociated protein 1 n=1 Tax=Glycine soja TaxID=3848 RepID=A0A0B2STD5_GLYSO|nr:Cullin-associated NEDD8-dissociated protein 1 [Glycine soja]